MEDAFQGVTASVSPALSCRHQFSTSKLQKCQGADLLCRVIKWERLGGQQQKELFPWKSSIKLFPEVLKYRGKVNLPLYSSKFKFWFNKATLCMLCFGVSVVPDLFKLWRVVFQWVHTWNLSFPLCISYEIWAKIYWNWRNSSNQDLTCPRLNSSFISSLIAAQTVLWAHGLDLT